MGVWQTSLQQQYAGNLQVHQKPTMATPVVAFNHPSTRHVHQVPPVTCRLGL